MLVGGLEDEFYDFPYIGKVIIPTDFHIFQRGSNHQPDPIVVTSRYLFEFSIARSILDGYKPILTSLLVFWYEIIYLLTS